MAHREVIFANTNEWIQTIPKDGLGEKVSIFTSLPDISEMPHIYHGYMIEEYKLWFKNTIVDLMMRLSVGNYIILLQSDTRMMNNDREAFEWVDKSHLASCAADITGCTLAWHKLVMTCKENHKRSTARPSYSHLLCYVKNPPQEHVSELKGISDVSKNKISYRTSLFAVPDVFYRGEMLWPKGIGLDCCYVGVMFLKHIAKAELIVDPFCGIGTVLAMANALGVNAKGVEISKKRCKWSRNTIITEDMLKLVSPQVKEIQAEIVEERAHRQSQQERLNYAEDALAQAKEELAADPGDNQESEDESEEEEEEEEEQNGNKI